MKSKEIFAFLGVSLAWGSSFFWIKIAVQEIGPFTLVATRLLLGWLGLSAYIYFRRPDWPRGRRHLGGLIVLAVVNVAAPFMLVTWGELHVESTITAVLMSSVPIFTAIFAHLFLRDDRLDLLRGAGVLVGFAGVLILLLRDLNLSASNSMLGQAAILLAALLYSGGSVFARLRMQDVSPIIQAFIPVVFADLLLWVLTPLVESPLTFPDSALAWLALLWLGIIGSGFAYVLFYYLLHKVGATRTSLVAYTFPVIGVLLGVLFLNEALDWNLLVGGSLVVGSIAIVNRRVEAK